MYLLPDDLSARLDAVDAPLPDPGRLRHAAVLALILPEGEGRPHEDPRLLLIKRSAGLRAHAGQIAFPGGKPEPHDTSLLHTALRESQEEVGLLGACGGRRLSQIRDTITYPRAASWSTPTCRASPIRRCTPQAMWRREACR